MMLCEGIHLIGDGLLDVAEEKLHGLLVQDDINEIYNIEQTPFARGKFAAVRRAVHKKSGVHFAAKFLKRRRRAQSSDKEIKHEIAVLILCSGSDNIVKLNAVHESTSDTALLLELATGGELQAFLDNEGSLTEAQTRICMKEVLKALQFLHKKSIAHLDLKPQNILLTGERIEDGLKLCDFGISRVIEHGSKVREILGTPDYVAPEVLQYEPLSLQTDMWSVGVLTYVLLTGCSPFAGDTKQETFLNISQCDLTFPDDLFDGVSEHAIDFIKSTLRIKPNDRLTAADCLDHIWLKDDFIVDKRFYNISMASDGISSDPDENLDDFDDLDDSDQHEQQQQRNSICCSSSSSSSSSTNITRHLNDCTTKQQKHFPTSLNLSSSSSNIGRNTHRYKKLDDHDVHHDNNDDHNDHDDYNKENFLINSSSEIVVLINNSVNNAGGNNSSPNNSSNSIKTNRISRDNNLYNNSLNTTNNGINNVNGGGGGGCGSGDGIGCGSSSSNSSSSILTTPNNDVNYLLDKCNGLSSLSSSTITLNSSCTSSGSLSSVIVNNNSTTNSTTCLFPDAPTTPKVIRKAPSSESPTSVKALVKKFQLESGCGNIGICTNEQFKLKENSSTTIILGNNSTTQTTTIIGNHSNDDINLFENNTKIICSESAGGLKYCNNNNNANSNNRISVGNSNNDTTTASSSSTAAAAAGTTTTTTSYKSSCVFCLTCGPGCRHPSNSVVNSNKTSNSLGLDQGIIC